MTGANVLIVAGPTASGKSALALSLAETLGGTVVNADSMQVYRAVPLLTAQPAASDRARVPHSLYGVLDPEESCSAQRWRGMAVEAIAAARAEGRLPIVTGGTGLYLRALREGLSLVPDIPPAVRLAALADWEALGPAAFRARLAQHDPAIAARLEPGDRQRHVRAWEVVAATGRALSAWQAEAPEGPPAGLRFHAILLLPPRDWLRERIALRFAAMMEAGALEEVRELALAQVPPGAPVMKALGVAPLLQHLAGKTSLEQAVDEAVATSRQYAKRQVTWFRHQFPADLVINEKFSDNLLQRIFPFIRQNLLTVGI